MNGQILEKLKASHKIPAHIVGLRLDIDLGGEVAIQVEYLKRNPLYDRHRDRRRMPEYRVTTMKLDPDPEVLSALAQCLQCNN